MRVPPPPLYVLANKPEQRKGPSKGRRSRSHSRTRYLSSNADEDEGASSAASGAGGGLKAKRKQPRGGVLGSKLLRRSQTTGDMDATRQGGAARYGRRALSSRPLPFLETDVFADGPCRVRVSLRSLSLLEAVVWTCLLAARTRENDGGVPSRATVDGSQIKTACHYRVCVSCPIPFWGYPRYGMPCSDH